MKISRTEYDNYSEGFGISSVGTWLKAAREARGINLDEVAKITRIGKNYLHAIEAGDPYKLPSQAYTRGFIRLYAAHLGLSPEKALTMLDASPVDSTETSPDRPSNLEQIRRSPSAYSRRLAWVITLALALAAGYLLLKPATQSSTPVQASRVEALPADQSLKKVPPQQEQNSPPTNEPSLPPPSQLQQGESQGIVLRLKAVSDGKIHITIDGSASQEYELVSGDLVEWKAGNTIILDLENAASVEGELNGVKMAPFGEAGIAAHLVLKNE